MLRNIVYVFTLSGVVFQYNLRDLQYCYPRNTFDVGWPGSHWLIESPHLLFYV